MSRQAPLAALFFEGDAQNCPGSNDPALGRPGASIGNRRLGARRPSGGLSEQVTQMLAKGAKPRAIYDYVRLEVEGFRGSHSAIKRLCRRLGKQRGIEAKDVGIPVLSAPGEIAQVDSVDDRHEATG